MGSLHDFRITHRDHEPATDRSADSLVRECLGLDSCGHGCRRSDSRFMESLLSLLRTRWDQEPLRLTEARSGPRVCDPQPARFMESPLSFFACIGTMNHPLTRPPGTLSPSEGERDGVRGRFMERGQGGRLANERFSESPECCAGFLLTRIFGDAEEAGEHADHISVENRRRLIESDAEHGAGRVAANAG